jgi:SAM-dependent methyltransferase
VTRPSVWRRLRRRWAAVWPSLTFRTSERYWEKRYARGGTSGAGSYGDQAVYKSQFLNEFVRAEQVQRVIELGCGDGHQLGLAEYPVYLGLDVSKTAIRVCVEAFGSDRSKSFLYYDPELFVDPARFVHGDLALSLDVIYHLTEDDVYERYMKSLFNASDRFVIVYARSQSVRVAARHVRHRAFTEWVAEHAADWNLRHLEPAPSPAYQEFYVFARSEAR